jgi:hypothetical protein
MGGQGFDVVFERRNNKIKLQSLRIWPLNPKTMVGKFCPSEVFTIIEEEGAKNAY